MNLKDAESKATMLADGSCEHLLTRVMMGDEGTIFADEEVLLDVCVTIQERKEEMIRRSFVEQIVNGQKRRGESKRARRCFTDLLLDCERGSSGWQDQRMKRKRRERK